MNNYKLTEKCNWWNQDHHENFKIVRESLCGVNGLSALEVGVFEARSSIYILDHIMTGKDCYLHCIDPDIRENGRYNLKLHKNVTLFEDYSINILPILLKERCLYDFIYVDGDHNASGVLSDIIMSWRLLKVGGFFLIDDYEMPTLDPWFYESHSLFKNNPRLNFTHPRIAIDAFLNIYRGQYDFFANNYQIGVIKSVEMYSRS